MQVTGKHAAKSVINAAANAKRLTLIAFVMAAIGGPLQASASAALLSDHNHGEGLTDSSIGSGRNNLNAVTVSSPIFNRGSQHVGNITAGGSSVGQNASCRKKLNCKIYQKVRVASRR